MFPEPDQVRCPPLVTEAVPPHLVQFERFAGCGHGVVHDAPERAMALLREFILNG